ncbi:hypothetical protein RM572_24100 [Streptomyces sp. DSM 42041]|uniref:CHRD domain-containing protein n=1 Tax=Streptomyces hazeniae TaxID=3075538 RepID=A0ABU2NXY9_9ACTN|nr:hypothetical protein [Streptomyces sp. DSM 42041]MDT0381849.1 hypothetical protein [Streptomyces sp. DSM 42041]
MKKIFTTTCAAVVAAAPLMAFAPAATADDMPGPGRHAAISLQAQLVPFEVNKVHGWGYAKVRLDGRHVTVRLKAKGLLADAPHAQHFHIAAKGVCPPDSAATEHNGKLALSTVDGQPFYGGIGASLTTEGDTSPDSALAVDRFPVGKFIHYERSFTVSEQTARSLRDDTAVLVLHGIDYNRNGRYDFNLGRSELDPELPLEATAPALCGALKKAPHGGISGGHGGTQGSNDELTAAAAGTGLLALGGGAFQLRRRTARTARAD